MSPPAPPTSNMIQLCASCDRCRSRKTKCDGSRPCLNCKNRYMRVHKLTAEDLSKKMDSMDILEFDCIYSPAKRRGPVPGKSSASAVHRSAAKQAGGNNVEYSGSNNQTDGDGLVHSGFEGMTLQSPFGTGQQQPNNNNTAANNGGNSMSNSGNNSSSGGGGGVDIFALLGQLNVPQQQQQQQLISNGGTNSNINGSTISNNSAGTAAGAGTNIGATDQMKQMLLLQQQLMLQQQQIQQQQLAQQLAATTGQLGGGVGLNALGVGAAGGGGNGSGGSGGVVNNSSLLLLQQYQNSQQQQQPPQQQGMQMSAQQFQLQQQQQQVNNPMAVLSGQQQHQQQRGSLFYDSDSTPTPNNKYDDMTRSAKRTATTPLQSTPTSTSTIVSTHLPLLNPQNPSGTLLRQYFELSTNNVLNLPPIPTNEEYCALIIAQQQQQGMYNTNLTPENLPWYDLSALNAARFSQLALGALSNDQVGLALELSNACVMCLKNCVEESSHKACLSAVARAYLLHGILRSLRGDFVRYFKYRRVCMTQISMLTDRDQQEDATVDALLAAISFHDAWAYMMYNAVEDELPDIDTVLPRVNCNHKGCGDGANGGGFGCRLQVVTDPMNQMWIQGEPRIFLKNEARIVDRSLDAISCAVRSCCDQANKDFAEMAQSVGGGGGVSEMTTPTSLAVMASENELCSRNMVLSAQALINQNNAHERVSKPGLNMMITAMDAFLENSDQDATSSGGGGAEEGGFSETQIRNLLSACEMAIKHPFLLHSPGPVYHMISNAAVLLCHLLNGLHAKCSLRDSSNDSSSNGGAGGNNMESELFYNTLDTFMSIRKLLNMHRQNLPVRIRCHAIPRPNIGPSKKTDPETPFIDLGETLMCSCRGCQGFVLMGCSPCVAAERSLRSARTQAIELEDDDDFKREIDDLGDFNLDDDALFSILSRVASN